MKIVCTLQEWLNHGIDLVQLLNVDEVSLADREPYAPGLGGDDCFWWYVQESGSEGNADTLPTQLHGRLAGDGSYCDEADAAKALSDACLAWAIHEARARGPRLTLDP